jgi:hypothetical protein
MDKNLFNLLRKTRYALAIRIDTMRYNQEVDHESGPRQLIFTWTTVGLNSQKIRTVVMGLCIKVS